MLYKREDNGMLKALIEKPQDVGIDFNDSILNILKIG